MLEAPPPAAEVEAEAETADCIASDEGIAASELIEMALQVNTVLGETVNADRGD